MQIAACFIAAILAVSLLSRLSRAFELRVTEVDPRPAGRALRARLRPPDDPAVANEPDARDEAEYSDKLHQILADNDIPDEDVIFVEVTVTRPLGLRVRTGRHGARSCTAVTGC